MSREMKSAMLAGLLSGALFVFVYVIGLGFIFMFLPTIPLFFIALQHQPRIGMRASTIGTLLVMLAIGTAPAIVYLLLLGIPSWYIAKYSLHSRLLEDEKTIVWFPLALIFTRLTLYAVAFIATLTAYYADAPGGLPAMLAEQIKLAFVNLGSEYGDVVQLLAHDWSFLVFPVTIWLWLLTLYAHAWLANRLLAERGLAVRPSFDIQMFILPGWMLYLLALTGLASLIGSESMRFLGKSAMISLLLPYFFLGAALMHRWVSEWPSRKLFMFFVYFLIITQFWPALFLAGAGIWHQVKNINKHLSEGGSSSNN